MNILATLGTTTRWERRRAATTPPVTGVAVAAASSVVTMSAAMAVVLATALLTLAPVVHAQGSRKDDIVFGPGGHPVSGATVRVCQPAATGTPCTPLATVYTDATLMTTAANPFQTDGIGNYHFYAPAGRYQIQISSPQISGTITQPDVILPPDFSANNNVSAYGMNLSGSLSVAGNANVSGTLTTSSFNPGAFSPTSLNVTGNATMAGPRPYIDVTAPAYGAMADGGAESTTGTIGSGSNHLTVASATGFKVGMGIHVDGAGASGDVLLAHITAINGSIFTLDTNAGASVTSAGVQDDDTLALRAALNAFCTGQTNANGGSIYFPPGNYVLSQNQSSNPNAIPFQIACSGLHLVGGNGAAHNGTPFVQPPSVSLLAHCGASPNAQPLFGTYYPNGNMTFQNLVIDGCNVGVQVTSNVVRFWNTYITATGGQANGSALWVQDSFWVYFDYGGLTTSSTSVPTLLMTGASCSGCYVGVGNLYMSSALLAGGAISYVQQGNITGDSAGHWVFRNVTQESGNGDLIQITDPGAFTAGTIGPITLDDVQQSDNLSGSAALINFNVPGSVLSGLYINNSSSGAGQLNAPAVKITAGTLDHYFITGCDNGCVSQVWNSSGNPVGNGMTQSTGGPDIAIDVTNPQRLITAPLSSNNQFGTGPGARFFQSGSSFASYGIDPVNGWMFGSNTQSGWNAQIFQSAPPNIDFGFAANFPPTGVSATVSNTGGSGGTGTYYVWMTSTTSSSCASASTMSAGSNIYGPLTVGAGVTTASFNLTWTPATPGATPIQGYCVFTNIVNQYNQNSPSSAFIAGASTTSASVGSSPNNPGALPITYQTVQEDHFTPGYASLNGAGTPNASGAAPFAAACVVTMACSATLQLAPSTADPFTRANASSLGTNWAPNFATAKIAGNSAQASANTYAEASWAGQNFLGDQWSRAKIASVDAAAGVGVMVRLAGANVDTGYLYFCSTTSRGIYKRVTGTQTTLVTTGSGCAVNDIIELDAVGNNLIAIRNGTVDLTTSDSAIASGAPGIALDNTGTPANDSLINWLGGNLPLGNATTSLFSQPNTWTQPQTFLSPITSGSLATPNKTRACSIIRGDQSGSVLTTGNIQPQGSLCYIDAAATVAQVIVMADAGASTMQLGYRHNGSTTAISPALTPATVSGITDHVACANAGGTAITIEGNTVTCSTLTNTALTAGDFIETIGGAADGTTKRLSIAMTFSPN